MGSLKLNPWIFVEILQHQPVSQGPSIYTPTIALSLLLPTWGYQFGVLVPTSSTLKCALYFGIFMSSPAWMWETMHSWAGSTRRTKELKRCYFPTKIHSVRLCKAPGEFYSPGAQAEIFLLSFSEKYSRLSHGKNHHLLMSLAPEFKQKRIANVGMCSPWCLHSMVHDMWAPVRQLWANYTQTSMASPETYSEVTLLIKVIERGNTEQEVDWCGGNLGIQ